MLLVVGVFVLLLLLLLVVVVGVVACCLDHEMTEMGRSLFFHDKKIISCSGDGVQQAVQVPRHHDSAKEGNLIVSATMTSVITLILMIMTYPFVIFLQHPNVPGPLSATTSVATGLLSPAVQVHTLDPCPCLRQG